MRLLKILACGLALLAAASCTMVTSQVEGYSAIPADITPRSVHIAPAAGMQADSLAWRRNAGQLAAILAGKGFASVARNEARLLVRFGYDSGDPETETYPVRVPIHGVVGYRRVELDNGEVRIEAIRGTIGHRTEQHQRVVHPRRVTLTMRDSRTGQSVFEATARSRDTCAVTPRVIPMMLAAMLEDFPAARNGSVTLREDELC